MNEMTLIWFGAFLLATSLGFVLGIMYTRYAYRSLYTLEGDSIEILKDGIRHKLIIEAEKELTK